MRPWASGIVVDCLTPARDLAEHAELLYEPEAAAGDASEQQFFGA